jgi:hypothetical protein
VLPRGLKTVIAVFRPRTSEPTCRSCCTEKEQATTTKVTAHSPLDNNLFGTQASSKVSQLTSLVVSYIYTPKMTFLHLFVVNKSGSLIHHRPLSSKAPHIDINEWLRIGSTFHSLHAIAAEASPLRLPNNKNLCEFFYRTCEPERSCCGGLFIALYSV